MRDRIINKIKSWLSDPFGKKLASARQYVGTDDVSGRLQLELLKREGCLPSSKVLEIGCGCLSAGIKLIEYLERGNYFGIDPNVWLRKTAMKDYRINQLVKDKQAR